MRKLITDWVPPGATRVAQAILDLVRLPRYEYVPDGWNPKRAVRGWNTESVAQNRRHQWVSTSRAFQGTGPLGFEGVPVNARTARDLRSHNVLVSFAYVMALSARKKDRVSVLDWGGDIGSYRLLSQAVLKGVAVDYHCVEVPVICRVGRELQPDIDFVSVTQDWTDKCYDLVLASSAVHYVHEWKPLVKDLVSVSSGFLYITRLPTVRKSSSFVIIQRAYNTEYLGWVINRDELIEHVHQNGLVLAREFVNHEGPKIQGAPEQNVYMGFLFERKGTLE